MKIAAGRIIRIEYELKVKGGEVIETSAKTGPLNYSHGDGTLLPALEKRLEGMSVGEEKKGLIPASEAFPKSALPTKELDRAEFPATEKLDIGRVFAAKGPSGQPISFEIAEVKKDKVIVRFLPPLAGKDLEFRVRVLRIDDPKAKKRELVAPPPPPADAFLEEDKA